MIILGIETSCDETSVAILDDNRVLASHTFSQADIHALFGGVVPEVASRNHMEKIAPLFSRVMSDAKLTPDKIGIISVTNAPGLIGALFVGVAFAKGLAYALNKPIIPVHHLSGHILSAELSDSSLKPPYAALVASGGHTHIYDVTEPLAFRLWGRTVDDAVGESFDKVAKMLGGPYPGGPFIEKLAMNGNPEAVKFPVAFKDAPNFSFSGLKTAVLNKIAAKEHSPEDIAASFQHTVAVTLAEKTVAATKDLKRDKIAVSGGVACNRTLRAVFEKYAAKNDIKVYFPTFDLCNDNAAMIAYAAFRISQNIDLNEYHDLAFAAGDTRHEISVR